MLIRPEEFNNQYAIDRLLHIVDEINSELQNQESFLTQNQKTASQNVLDPILAMIELIDNNITQQQFIKILNDINSVLYFDPLPIIEELENRLYNEGFLNYPRQQRQSEEQQSILKLDNMLQSQQQQPEERKEEEISSQNNEKKKQNPNKSECCRIF